MIAQLSPLAGLVLVAASVTWLLSLNDLPDPAQVRAHLGRPTINQAAEAVDIRVQVRTIREFDHYYGDEDDPWRNLNPFLPHHERERTRERLDKRERAVAQGENVPKAPPDPRPSVKIEDPEEPSFPPLGAAVGVTPPSVPGMIGGGARTMLLVQPEGGAMVRVGIGETVDGWTVRGVDGEYAILAAADGTTHRVIIGSAESPVTVIAGDTVAGSGGTDPVGGGEDSAGGARRPSSPGRGPRDGGSTGEDDAVDEDAELLRLLKHPRVKAFLEKNPRLEKAVAQNPRLALPYLRPYRHLLDEME